MKLNLNIESLKKPECSTKQSPNPANSYASPIGWWNVSTEGDVEGRTTKRIGVFYGHVAEIAFHFADRVYYTLTFNPTGDSDIPFQLGRNPEPFNWTVKRKSLWISLGIDSGTWGMDLTKRAEWFSKWLNITNPKIECKGEFDGCRYYAACHLEIVDIP